jgi:hypothetical protein
MNNGTDATLAGWADAMNTRMRTIATTALLLLTVGQSPDARAQIALTPGVYVYHDDVVDQSVPLDLRGLPGVRVVVDDFFMTRDAALAETLRTEIETLLGAGGIRVLSGESPAAVRGDPRLTLRTHEASHGGNSYEMNVSMALQERACLERKPSVCAPLQNWSGLTALILTNPEPPHGPVYSPQYGDSVIAAYKERTTIRDIQFRAMVHSIARELTQMFVYAYRHENGLSK